MRDEIDFEPVAEAADFDRFAGLVQAEHVSRRQHVDAAQVVVAVGRREAVEVRAADRDEEQRIRLFADERRDAGCRG